MRFCHPMHTNTHTHYARTAAADKVGPRASKLVPGQKDVVVMEDGICKPDS